MTRERWTEIKPLLAQALDLPQVARQAFVAEHCGGDAELQGELSAYLELEPEVEDLFEQPMIDLIAGRPPEYRAGQRIGSYLLEDEIARGGMGVVYRGRRVEGGFEQTVAIKVLKRGYDTGDFVRRFRAEQQILANLDHPFIARLLDGGATEDGLPYLVMELVEGVPLNVHCEQPETSLAERLTLFERICDAVHTAHQHMVVHCDLKPSNILVTPQGEPKLLDFGIAKVLHQDAHTTRTFSVRLGTPPYASPEQIDGGSITTASDVYSLGGILFQLLAGEAPARAGGAGRPPQLASRALARRLANEGMEKAEAKLAVQEIRGDLDAIAMKAMARTSTDRYTSAAALSEDLDRHRRRLPVKAQPYSFAYALKLFLRRRHTEVALASGVILGAIAALAAVFVLSVRAEVEATRADDMYSAFLEMVEVIDETADESEDQSAVTAVDKLLESQPFRRPEDRAKLYDRLSRYFVRHGFAGQGLELAERSLALIRESHVEGSRQEAAVLNNLAFALRHQGELEKAAETYEGALTMYLANPKWEAKEKLDILHNLAMVKSHLGHLDRSEELQLEALELRRTAYGPRSRHVARTMMNLGALYIRQHRLDEAEPLLEDSLGIRQESYGPDHARVATSLINLAVLREAQGRRSEAIDLIRRALVIRRETFGDDSHQAALARSALGFSLLGRGEGSDLMEAELLLRQAFRDHPASKDADPDNTLAIQRNLAAIVLAKGGAEEAELLLKQVDSYASVRPPLSRWRVADARSLLGAALTAQGKLEEAGQYLEGTAETLAASKGAESRYAREAAERWREWQEAVSAAGESR